MTRTLPRVTAAELCKLAGLPAVLAAVLGTLAAAAGLCAAVAASASPPDDPVTLTMRTLRFLQVGLVLLGVLAVAEEYTSTQIRTTLTAVPHRPLLLAGKTLAYLAAAAATSAAAVAAGIAAAWVTGRIRGDIMTPAADFRPVAGAVAYLALIGLLAFALAALLRSLVAGLVTMLALVLIVSPLLAGVTEHARYLPDRAGRLLYLPEADAVLGPGTGALVLLAWIAATGALAVAGFLTRDA